MGLPNPIPGVGPGPDYALNLQSSVNILDAHNHASGSGVQINPNGIYINAALPFNGNPATLLGYLGISPQGTGVATPVNDSLYASGVDLYFQDGNGNAVRITSGGSVNATSSGISSGTATASFVSSILVVDQSAGVGAAIDAATYILRYNGSYPTPSGNYILLSAPSSLATGYQLTFPGITPSSSGALLTSDTSGTLSYSNGNSTITISGGVITVANLGVTASQIANNTITTNQISLSAGITGSQLSSSAGIVGGQIAGGTITNFNLATPVYTNTNSSGSYATSSPSFTTVTGLSRAITLDGLAPVILMLVPDGTTNASSLTCNAGSEYQFTRGGSPVARGLLLSGSNSIVVFDYGAFGLGAGAYTYEFQVLSGSGSLTVHNFLMVMYEI